MKVELISSSEESLEHNDYRDFYQINIDGKTVFNVSDGEPEDANLGRDFNDVYKIADLMQRAYDAGKNGETLEFFDVEE